ncbi:MAG: hypothetical protein ACRD0K_28935 [Egibacteraceae bacterium]
MPEEQPFSQEIRRRFRDAYDAEVLLYPVEDDHHHVLDVLEALGEAAPQPSGGPALARLCSDGRPLVERWVHDTTEDALYIEPSDALARLDRWTDDPQVRVVGVTGIGRLGKTALIGHWLKRGTLRRPAKGLLCWSFNSNRAVTAFFGLLSPIRGWMIPVVQAAAAHHLHPCPASAERPGRSRAKTGHKSVKTFATRGRQARL